jgi:hypothetical protein
MVASCAHDRRVRQRLLIQGQVAIPRGSRTSVSAVPHEPCRLPDIMVEFTFQGQLSPSLGSGGALEVGRGARMGRNSVS